METAKSLLLVPLKDYTLIRPHHVAVLYAAVRLVVRSSLVETIGNFLLALTSETTERLIPLAGYVPDFLIRYGIRIQLRHHLTLLRTTSATTELQQKMNIVEELHTLPIAIATDTANTQHYEVPAKFYDLCLGPCKKYSSGLWPSSKTTFEESEVHMLDLYCERAGVEDGMKVVDLGEYYYYVFIRIHACVFMRVTWSLLLMML